MRRRKRIDISRLEVEKSYLGIQRKRGSASEHVFAGVTDYASLHEIHFGLKRLWISRTQHPHGGLIPLDESRSKKPGESKDENLQPAP